MSDNQEKSISQQYEEQSKPNKNQQAMNGSLFAATLHPVTSKYIQQKYNMNSDSNELDNVDLRNMCENVKQELNQIEQSAAYDYLKVENEMKDLDSEIIQSDGILSELEDVLKNFRDHLNEIKSEMTSLQERSLQMNTSLTNRKQLSKLLGTFVDHAFIDPTIVTAINENPIDEDYVQYIKTLCQKLEYLKNSQLQDAKSVKELEPDLLKLKNKACGRVRTFLIEKISLLKKPMTNVQIMQKNYLVRFRIFTEFLKEHFLEIYVELCKNYAEILSKFYLNSFKTYCREVEKLVGEYYNKHDQVFNDNASYYRQNLSVKNMEFSQQGRSIFYLMDRENILKDIYDDSIQLNISSTQKNKKHTLETVFKSVNQRLIDCVQGEVIFTSEFFNLNAEQNEQIFGGIFKQAFNYLFDYFKDLFNSSYDVNGLLLIILINDKNKQELAKDKRFNCLDYYFHHIGIIVWPRLEKLFDMHQGTIENANMRFFKENERKFGWKNLFMRYVDFVLGVYLLYSYFDDNAMMCFRLTSLRNAIFKLISRSSQEIQKDFDKITYLLKVYDLFITNFNQCQLKQSKKEFQDDILKIEQETSKNIDEFIKYHMKDLFGNLQDFVNQYCKQESQELNQEELPQMKSQQSSESQVSNPKLQDNSKLVEVLCQDIQFSWSKRAEVFKLECEKLFSGMVVQKKILKKFVTTFMAQYGSFHKHLRNNYPSQANQLIKVHEMMKEIQKSYNI